MNWLESNTELSFYILLLVAVFLTRIPLIGPYFRGINTLIHEAGHVIATLLVSGEVIAVNLFADNSGTTVTKAKGKLSQIFISISGYPVSALMGLLCLFLLYKGYYLYIMFSFTSITLIIMVLSLRNMYGLFWAGTFVVLNLLIIYFNNKNLIYLFSAFYTLVVFTDAIISSVILMILAMKQPKKAGDATNLSKTTKIPAAIWAFLLLGFTLYVSWLSVIKYFPKIDNIL